MISRYTRPAMAALWTDAARYQRWLEVELAAVDAWCELGQIPPAARETIHAKAVFSVERIQELERETRHDVLAFTTNLAEQIGPDSRYVHLGLTSSDVLDTALALQIQAAARLLDEGFAGLIAALDRRAAEFRKTLMIGRSHGIHAEPITFGWKLHRYSLSIGRARERVWQAAAALRVGKFSGAVGTWAATSPDMERLACTALGLEPDPAASQVIGRDRHAAFMSALALAGAAIEEIAIELRHLQRTEVGEVQEGFAPGQKGSSAMPHKRNPITGEQLTGLARLLRSYAGAALENIALWHERDISHSSVERVILPDGCILLDYMLATATGLIENLVVFPERMLKNLELTCGAVFSQRLLLHLIEQRGLSREDAYALVQRAAHQALDTGRQLAQIVREDAELSGLVSAEEAAGIFDYGHYVRFIVERIE